MKLIPLSLTLLAGTLAVSAQSNSVPVATPAPSRDSSPEDPVTQLDALVVTGALDAKTAFDLAQGASILSGHGLEHRRQASLGDTLDGLPGVTSTYFGPGSGRPIIRGFTGDRVRVLSEGVGAQDLSTLSPDHAVAVETALAERIEVLRGPATLLYGNSAVGGVVNVIDGRVPLTAGLPFLHAESRWDSNSNGRTGVFSAGTTKEGASFKVQGSRSLTDDLRAPGRGKVAGTSLDSKFGSVGFGLHGDASNWGLAASQQESFYGVPVADEAIAIDMRQRKLDLAGEQRLSSPWFSSLRTRAASSDYRHFERDREGEREIHSTFTQRGWEGRAELQQVKQGGFGGVSGLQLSASRVSSVGEEVVTPPYRQQQLAFFTLQEWSRPGLTLQWGGRVEHQRLSLGEVPEGLPAVDGYAASSGEQRRGWAPSAGAGVVYYPDKDTSLALSVSASERLPLGPELFANGPHGGTGSYEVGRADLQRERSFGAEISAKRRAGAVTGAISGFVQRFSNYLYEARIADDAVPEENNEEGLPVYQYHQARAEFVGAEAELAFHFIEEETRNLHLELSTDAVRATNTTADRPLPRITPVRLTARLTFEQGAWYAAASVRQVLRQTRVDENETPTAGHVLLGLEAGWQRSLGRHRVEVFARGQNLGDRLALVHTSYLKDTAPLPGRGVVLGVRYLY